jgi:hypothetical protein
MRIVAAENSTRRAARAAGFLFLLTMAVIVASNFGISERLMVAGDAATTARNVVAHERLFRIGIVCDLVYAAGLMALLSALYVVLRPAGPAVALLAAVFRLVYAIVWVGTALDLLSALRVLTSPGFQRTFGPDQLPDVARLFLSGFDAYYVGLLFYALASTLCAVLWLSSRAIPRALAGFGLIASGWCAACAMTFLAVPAFSRIVNLWWFDTPMALFELATGLWLLVRGPNVNATFRAAPIPA